MKLKDFLKQFENEDPETEIVQQTNDQYKDLEKDIDITYCFVSSEELEKDLISDRTYKRVDEKQIRVIRIG